MGANKQRLDGEDSRSTDRHISDIQEVHRMNNFWKVLTLFFLGAIFVAVMTHAKGFSTAAGTLFTGVNSLGQTLEAGNIKQGST